MFLFFKGININLLLVDLILKFLDLVIVINVDI